MRDIAIDNMLADFGIAHGEFQKARAALFEEGVIRRRPDRYDSPSGDPALSLALHTPQRVFVTLDLQDPAA